MARHGSGTLRGACPRWALAALGIAATLAAACTPYGGRHAIQWDARDQIWLAEESQVKVRAAQSRVFESHDPSAMLHALVATYQDLGFQIDVLDETLGIISGKKFLGTERPGGGEIASYLLYDEESLVVFNRSYRSWGPFLRRSDLVRLTTTVRERNAEQLIVRAAAQFYLRPVEDPAAYQKFFTALEQALFTDRVGGG